MLTREMALTRFDLSRKALLETLAGLGDVQMTLPGAEGSWSVQELLCHLAAWEVACLEPLRRFAAGQPFEAEEIADHDAWNRAQVDRRREASVRDVLEELDEVRGSVLKVVEGLTAERWQTEVLMPWGERGSVAKMIDGLAWHEEEHTDVVRNWKKNTFRMIADAR